MKKRVLQLIGSFHQGGSERQALALARMLKAEGSCDVLLATLNPDGILKAEAEAIARREIPSFPLTSFYDLTFFRQVRRFARFLREERIDIIHTHDFYTNVFGMAAASLAGVPVRIASKRETGGMRSRAQNAVERMAFRRATAVLANSNAVRDHLVAGGINGARVGVIHNSVDLARFAEKRGSRTAIRKALGIPEQRNVRVVTMVANLRHNVKNVPMFLRVARHVTAELPSTHFVVAGEGELATDLQTLARELGIAENVHFLGRCEDVPSLLAASDVCVLTSNAEGFANVVLEYMAAAKPIVTTDAGGVREAVLIGESGSVVASDDDAAMSREVIAYLRDPAGAKSAGLRGRQIVEEKFAPARHLSAVLALYSGDLRDGKIYNEAGELCKI